MAELVQLLRRAMDGLDAEHEAAPPRSRRAAGVLLLFDSRDERLPLLFLERTAHLRHHAGQIGFPGGGSEASDVDIVDTALREAAEEAGIPRQLVEVIGLLPPFLTATSDNWLTPVIGVHDCEIDLRRDPFEVARLFRVDLCTLMDAPHTVRTMSDEGRARDVHFYEVAGTVIWGVTAAIVAELLTRIRAQASGADQVSGQR
ncbi:MAG: CoA pyrophosphatase [Candidatus Dormibacteraeota bacterium]|uniref:CoA pyrophosphatase n=1 Tax=Candidatus Amunia macphersoniae TaxID=3127014 RepID=A0A934KIG0_9BACT|nr:CoA pyrophosphatase [Candidatus Dormibacteraeota bacterium]